MHRKKKRKKSLLFGSDDTSRYKILFEIILELQSLFETQNQHFIFQAWKHFENESHNFMDDFNAFKKHGCDESKSLLE